MNVGRRKIYVVDIFLQTSRFNCIGNCCNCSGMCTCAKRRCRLCDRAQRESFACETLSCELV